MHGEPDAAQGSQSDTGVRYFPPLQLNAIKERLFKLTSKDSPLFHAVHDVAEPWLNGGNAERLLAAVDALANKVGIPGKAASFEAFQTWLRLVDWGLVGWSRLRVGARSPAASVSSPAAQASRCILTYLEA